MSTLSLSCGWPDSFSFPAHKIPSNGSMLEERQKLVKFTFDLAAQLSLPDRCVYTAITYIHLFLTIQPSTQIYPLRVCQASIFLASKTEENVRRIKDVYKYTNKILDTKSDETSDVINFHVNAILDYENRIIATLGLGVFIRHSRDFIDEAIKDIQDQNRSLPTEFFNELTKLACYIEKQSILLTPFCVKYSVDLIAWFCIQLAIEIENDRMKSIHWTNKPSSSKQIQNLINEFSVIYIKRSSAYKKKFVNEENEYGEILHKKALYYAELLIKKPVTLAIIGEGVFGSPSSSVSNTSQQGSPLSSILSSTTASSSYISYQHTAGETLSTHQNPTESKPVNTTNAAKRHHDLTTESSPLVSKKRQKK